LVAWLVRRRMRRMAEARPVTDAVVERDIMVGMTCAFWRAVIARCAIGCAAGLWSVSAPGRERCLRSNRVVASDWLLRHYLPDRSIRQTDDGPGWSGAVMIHVSSPKRG
jgi:hypothetical protein